MTATETGSQRLWKPEWDRCHPHACQYEAYPLETLERHAYALGDAIVMASGPRPGWEGVSDLLHMLGGLEHVQVTTARFDDAPMYCEPVLEWESARSRLASEYATDVVRLLLTYNVFEAVTSYIPVSRRALKRLKPAGAAARLLFERGPGLDLPVKHYVCATRSLQCVAQKWDGGAAFCEILAEYPDPAAHWEAMALVQRVRNRFVHEAFRFPPDPDSPKVAERGVVRRATRVTLLTIQMLAMVTLAESLPHAAASELRELREAHLRAEDDDDE